MWIDQPPLRCHPLAANTDGTLAPDLGTAVELFPLRPDLVEQLVAWAGGEHLLVGGTSAVLLPGVRPVRARLVGLGDYAARSDGKVWAERAAGIAARYVPA